MSKVFKQITDANLSTTNWTTAGVTVIGDPPSLGFYHMPVLVGSTATYDLEFDNLDIDIRGISLCVVDVSGNLLAVIDTLTFGKTSHIWGLTSPLSTDMGQLFQGAVGYAYLVDIMGDLAECVFIIGGHGAVYDYTGDIPMVVGIVPGDSVIPAQEAVTPPSTQSNYLITNEAGELLQDSSLKLIVIGTQTAPIVNEIGLDPIFRGWDPSSGLDYWLAFWAADLVNPSATFDIVTNAELVGVGVWADGRNYAFAYGVAGTPIHLEITNTTTLKRATANFLVSTHVVGTWVTDGVQGATQSGPPFTLVNRFRITDIAAYHYPWGAAGEFVIKDTDSNTVVATLTNVYGNMTNEWAGALELPAGHYNIVDTGANWVFSQNSGGYGMIIVNGDYVG